MDDTPYSEDRNELFDESGTSRAAAKQFDVSSFVVKLMQRWKAGHAVNTVAGRNRNWLPMAIAFGLIATSP